MIMQVLSQGPSLLLAVWTGLALLEGGESVCSYSCATATTESHNVRQGDSSVFSCEGTSISWCYTSQTPTQTITTSSNNQGIRKSWLVYSNIRSSMTLQCDSSSSCIKKISVNVIVPLSSVSISGSSKVGYRTTLRLTCSISGTRGTYYWYRNGTYITSTTSSSYSKSPAQLSDTGYYQCRACNWAGCRFSSNSQTVRVTVPPHSVSISGSSSIGSSTTLRLTCSASGIVERYQWYHNRTYSSFHTSYSNLNSNSYVKSSAQLTNSGFYYCRACNWAGCTISSSSHTVTVTAPSSASISGSTTVGYTQRLHLTCSVSGIANSYQWYRDYTRLSSTSSYYSKSAQQSDIGSYQCRACNWAGCTSYSSRVRVTVTAVRPSSARISGRNQVRYTYGLSLTCSASGIVDSYKWYRNSSLLTTTTTNRYYKSSAQLSDTGYYQCVACNWAGCSSTSSSRIVTVTEPPYSVRIGGISKLLTPASLRLTCYASGAVERYEWYHSGSRLPSTVSYYRKSPAQLSDSGSYQCRACNWAGCTSSSSYTVTVIASPVATAVVNPQVYSCNGRRSGSTYSALNGTSHHFRCRSAGSPPLSSYWKISTLSTTVNKTTTFSTMLSHNDEGRYVCTVRNTAESDLEDTEEVTVKVYDPPVLNIVQSTVIVKEGEHLDLQCSFTKHTNDLNPFPTITWTDPSGRTSGGSQTTQGLTLTSTYTRSSASRGDSGVYTCSVNNCPAVGELSDVVNVTIYYVPDAVDVSSIEVTNTTFDTISIQWTPPNNNFDSIIDYRVVLFGSGGLVGVFTPSQPMVTLVSLQPFTTYQIRISAQNNAGWGGNSGLRNVNTLTRDEVLVSSPTYSTPRVGVSSYTVELRWAVPKGLLSDKLEGYRLSRWPTNTTNIETTIVNKDNVSCAWNVTTIGSETYCHEWEGFSPGSQYTVSLEIVYNYGILSTGGPTNVTITIPTLPPSQEVGAVGLAVGVAVGVLLALLVTAVVLIVVLLICRKCRCSKTKDTDTAAVYNVSKDMNDNPLETVQFEPAYGGDDYTLTDDPRYVTEDLKMARDPHCASKDRVTSQEQHYASLDLKSVQSSAYASLTFNQNSSTAISKYRDNTNNTSEYETPEKVVPQKKLSTQQTHEYANWNVIDQQHGEGDQSSVHRKSSNKIPSTSGPGVKEVGKETTAPRKSQVIASDVTMPTKKEDIGDTHHLTLPKKHEQREKIPPPTKQRKENTKKQSTLHPPTQESATSKPQARPQQTNPVMTGSPSDASPKLPITSKAKKQPLLPKKVPPEQSAVAKQPPPGSNVTELRKKIENKYSVN